MLIDTRKETDNKGFNPNVDNQVIKAQPTSGERTIYLILIILSWLLILPGLIWWIKRIQIKNSWVNQQMEINNAASVIEINLTRRAETLIKLLEQTKGYLKHERETLINITRERSGRSSSLRDIDVFDRTINDVSRNIKLAFENYPDLKGSSVVGELMSSSQYIESEISASRRLYNKKVEAFNSSILTFPNICLAVKLNMETLPLFAATAIQKEDVNMSSLSDF